MQDSYKWLGLAMRLWMADQVEHNPGEGGSSEVEQISGVAGNLRHHHDRSAANDQLAAALILLLLAYLVSAKNRANPPIRGALLRNSQPYAEFASFPLFAGLLGLFWGFFSGDNSITSPQTDPRQSRTAILGRDG